MGPLSSIPEFLSFLRRRWLLIALVAFLGALGGVIAALYSERVYSATAVIQVITPVIDGEGAAVATTLARRIQTLEQQLMSRENLLDLARRYEMFADTNLTANEQVHLLRQSISIQSIAAVHSGYASDGAISGLVISASASEPEVAAAIGNELADMLLQQTAASRHESAQAALRFYQGEEARLQTEISALDDRIVTFQTDNDSLLPGAQVLRREDLRRLEENRLEIEREIVQLQAERATLDATSTRTVTLRRVVQLDDEIASRNDEAALIAARIGTIRAELVQAPEIAREMAAMDRAMTQLQSQLASVSERRRDAELGLRIEDDQQSVRFVLLEAALAPEYPISSGRRKIAMVGVLGGIVAGFGLAFLLELLRPVLRTARQMEREMQLRPVISIPYTPTAGEERRKRAIRMMGMGLLLFIALMLALSLL